MRSCLKCLLSLMVILFILSGCSKDDDSVNQNLVTSKNFGGNDSQVFVNYGIDTTNLRTKYYYQFNNDTIEFTGIKNGYLWFAEYRKSSKQKLYEWKDVEKIDNPLNVYFGYGKYNRFDFNRFYVGYYKKTGTGSIVNISFQNNNDSSVNQCIFIVNNISEHRTDLDIHKYYELSNWYGEYTCMRIKADQDVASSYVIYDENGDSVFSLKRNIPAAEHLVSVSQCINNSISKDSIIDMERYDLLKNNIIWEKSIPLGFSLPQNAKVSYTIQKQDTIWTYNYAFLYYDGTKKNFLFSIDVNTGVYKIGETN